MNAARRFRELLAAPGPIIAPGVYDCISAKVTERAGFPAAFVSGGAVTASVPAIRTSVCRQCPNSSARRATWRVRSTFHFWSM